MQDNTLQLIEELAGEVCRCGKRKAGKMTFCAGCYRRLPHPMQMALYRRVGQGYEEAYAAAVEFLK